MDIQNILWKLDGTLFDTYPSITYALSNALKESGCSVSLNVIDGFARQSLDHRLATLSQRFKLDPDLLRLRFTESYLAIPLANQPPFPGVKEVCTLIQERGGLNVIVTHRNAESTQRLLDVHNLAHLFAGIQRTERGYPREPAPALLETAIQQFKVKRAETLVIGDRDLDIQEGRMAGVLTCLFGHTQLSNPADIQIDRYSHLLYILKDSN